MQGETINVEINGKIYKLEYEESTVVDVDNLKVIDVKISHDDYFLNDSNSLFENTFIKTVTNSTVLIIDAKYQITNLGVNPTVLITNSVVDIRDDFGYLIFDLQAVDCHCYLTDIYPLNKSSILKTQKLLCYSDFFDFPPFSSISAIRRYNAIKKLCKSENIITMLRQKQNGC